jgi:uncharacterized protein YfaP (DUF2135 family)
MDDLTDMSDTVWRDVIMLALAGFMVIVIILLPHINPDKKGEVKMSGEMIITATWPDMNADVDLWVLAPDGRPVGFSSKHGPHFNLLRDDLGKSGDATNINLEVAISRGLPNGEYVINVHWYNNLALVPEVPVAVAVQYRNGVQMETVFERRVVLQAVKEELTVVRFRVQQGRFLSKSVHYVPKVIRG